MRRSIQVLLAASLACLAAAALAGDPAREVVDKLFTSWDKLDTPGLSLAVVRDGKIVYSRGYGMANLEYGVPNAPSTVFHAASLSKQFTAFSIQLLAQEGKLSLDDSVRKHLPELNVEGPTITIRHLLHHTSGLRDQWDLLRLAGLRMDDGITDSDILPLIWQQKQLNFAPGEDELYSNSGYSLLGLIVRRVSGQTLAAFAKERIFVPLGMKNTHFQEAYGALVKGRAYSYQRTRDGYRYLALSYSNTGATSLFTTVEDLALWNSNFDDGRAGGASAIAAMLTPGRLNNGREINYGAGLAVVPYRGVPTVSHSGSDAAYRAYFLRFPQQRLAVVLLGNASDLTTHELAHRVADLYLEGMPGVQPRRAFPAEVDLQARDLAPYVGEFEVRPGGVLTFSADNGKLFAQSYGNPRIPFFASAANQFFAKGSETTIIFPQTASNDPVPTAMWKAGEREFPLKRVVRETPSAEALQACVGDYYSEELRTLYALSLRDGKLVVRYPRGVLEMRPINRDIFTAGFPMGTFVMQRNAAGACEGFALTTGRVRNLRFARVKLVSGL
jgi:CubicO group peptidase (beta-lactamase class C family)